MQRNTTVRRRRRGAADSVDRELSIWMAELPGVDEGVESVRMRLLRLGRQLERLLSGIAETFNMTLGDWETLSVLRRESRRQQMSPTALAQALSVTSGTMSVRLDRLIRAGLVEPVASASDGRSRPVRLTAAGHQRWEDATRVRTETERAMFGHALSEHQVALLNSLLRAAMISCESRLGPAPPRGDRK